MNPEEWGGGGESGGEGRVGEWENYKEVWSKRSEK